MFCNYKNKYFVENYKPSLQKPSLFVKKLNSISLFYFTCKTLFGSIVTVLTKNVGQRVFHRYVNMSQRIEPKHMSLIGHLLDKGRFFMACGVLWNFRIEIFEKF